MKALTLFQPWATLVVYGLKHIETRSWRTSFRGPLVIHASKNVTYMPHLLVLLSRGQVPPEVRDLPYPTGALLGEVRLVHCAPTSWFIQGRGRQAISLMEEALGDYREGRWGWAFQDPEPYARPAPWKGQRGLWTLDREKETADDPI